METMKEDALKFFSERSNITSKTHTSLVNRAHSVIGKEHSTTQGAISGLIASLKALANDEKTSAEDSLEVMYIADVFAVLILPTCVAIDASVKAKQASKANTNKAPKIEGKREAWADSQEEAQELRAKLEPAKPARGRKNDPQAPALDLDSVARLLATILEGRA
jgi:hypothetical protein